MVWNKKVTATSILLDSSIGLLFLVMLAALVVPRYVWLLAVAVPLAFIVGCNFGRMHILGKHIELPISVVGEAVDV